MNSTEISKVVQAIERSLTDPIRVTEEGKGFFKILLPFTDLLDEPFYLWAFKRPKSKKILFSDARMLTRGLREAGDLHLFAIQSLVKTYDLSLMEDESIMEITNRPLGDRVASFIQCVIAVDGVRRMWNTMKESKTA